jgi:bidirectional [NiFe] hydrogenase diaphorase subunit
MPTLTIDGKKIIAPEGATILQAARSAGIRIPTLCHHEGLEPWGGCRLCVVDLTKPGWDGWCKMVVSCMYEAEEGIVVMTDTNRVK